MFRLRATEIHAGGEFVALVSPSEAVEREWEELAARVGASPFRYPGWFRAWRGAFARTELEILAAWRGGRLVGAVPLVRAGRRKLDSPTNCETPDFGFVAEDAAARQALADALFKESPRRVLIRLLDSEGLDYAELRRAAARARYRTLERGSMHSPYVAIGDSWDAYERGLSRNVRGDARRRLRRLEEQGKLALHIESGGDLQRLLDEGYRLESSGWKAERGTAIGSRPELRRFYTEIAEWAAERGWLRICFLRLGGVAIAFHFNLVVDGVLYHLKGGYDPAFARFSPGKVLHYLMLEHAFKTELERYEFLGEDEPYKLRLANSAHARLQFHAFAPRPVPLAERAAYVIGLPVGRRLIELTRNHAPVKRSRAHSSPAPTTVSPER